jgi:hypothetical protein
MAESISKRVNATQIGNKSQREMLAILNSMQADIAAIAAQFNQLRTDYNANATIATDTTATAVTVNTQP